MAGMARHDDAQLVTGDVATIGADASDSPALLPHAGDFAFLDHMHAHIGTGPRIAPGHRIMARGPGPCLPERAQHRIARTVEIDNRYQFLDPLRRNPLCRHTLQRVGMGRTLVATDLVLGLGQHHHAARREHDVVVQVLAHRLVERAGLFVDRGGGVLKVVRADDRGVAARIAAAQPAFLQDRDIGDAEILAKVIGGGQPVAPCPNDDHLVFLFRLRRRPGALPSHVVACGFAGDGKGGI